MEGHFINREGTKKDIKIWEDKDRLCDEFFAEERDY